MTEPTEEKDLRRILFNKRTPTKGEKYFIPLPSDARHYIHLDCMSADKLFLYQLIIDYYNPQEGYAFPSIERLSIDYGKTPNTTSAHVDDLKTAGLIDFPEKGCYVPLVPLPADEFYKEYPRAWTNYQEAVRRSRERRESSRERKRAWLAERGYIADIVEDSG